MLSGHGPSGLNRRRQAADSRNSIVVVIRQQVNQRNLRERDALFERGETSQTLVEQA